ncbi:MAG: carboxypeptidase regulatory-like domain-containing protein, partial [Acidobacteriaceae bacterium]|nr:carboxypeptidase regulatory-like domain-containing protein [Acidobacteriaceae bacterium]
MFPNSALAYRSRFVSILQTLIIVAGLTVSLPFGQAWAQATNTGTVSGQITDQQGAAIAGTELKLIDTSTGVTRTTISNDTGRYTFVNVDPGVYDMEARKSGFALAKVSQQKVDVGLVLTINLPMQVGSISTTVEVQAQAGAELQTTNATVGSTITGKSIEALPNLGRDANAFVLLQPGVAPGGQVAGAVADQNAYQLDGASNSSDMDGNQITYTQGSGYIGSASTGGAPSGVMPTPAESIEEFKVGTTNQTADFNQSAGGQIQMVTKRGTNQFHGSVYDYYLGSNFGANFWKNNHTPSPQQHLAYTPLPSSHQNRFGASLGGILLPSFAGGRTYFFVNYEGRRFPQVTTIERTVPSDLLRAGVIQVPNSAGIITPYNIDPNNAIVVNGIRYNRCSGNYCDPLGIGLNPLIRQIWTQQMPRANDPQFGDTYNTQGYLSA